MIYIEQRVASTTSVCVDGMAYTHAFEPVSQGVEAMFGDRFCLRLELSM